eukprot:799683_1
MQTAKLIYSEMLIMSYEDNYYLHVLSTMNPSGQSEMVQKYNEEARSYQQQNTFMSVCGDAKTNLDFFVRIKNKIIRLLEQILNDGALPLDVAFCRLIVLYGYCNLDRYPHCVEYIAFLLYFMFYLFVFFFVFFVLVVPIDLFFGVLNRV